MGMQLTTDSPFFNMSIRPDCLHPQLKTSYSFRRSLVIQPPVTSARVKSLCPSWCELSNLMALAMAEEVVEDLDSIRSGAILDAMKRLELVSCSWEGCLRYGQRGPRVLIPISCERRGHC